MHKIVGTLLFYSKAIYLVILVVLGKKSVAQTIGTIKTEKGIYKLLDYCATHPGATLKYNSSGM